MSIIFFVSIACTGRSTDITAWFRRLTLDVILSTAFGVTTDVQTSLQDTFAAQVHNVLRTPEVLRPLLILPFGSALQRVVNRFIRNPFTFLQILATDIIKTRRERAKDGVQCRNDLLQSMLDAHLEPVHEKGMGK